MIRPSNTAPSPTARRQNANKAHEALVRAIDERLKYERDLMGAPLKNGRGRFRNSKHDAAFGWIAGAGDWMGILTGWRHNSDVIPSPVPVFIEAKTGKAVQTKEQREFADRARSFGCFYSIVHSVSDAVEAVKRARKGLLE